MGSKPVKLGFALEGNSDYNVIPILVSRYVQRRYALQVEVETLRPSKRGNGFVKDLPNFAKLLVEKGTEVLVVVVDTDNSRTGERREQISKSIERINQMFAICVSYGLAAQALEAWLMSDIVALKMVFRSQRTLDEPPSPETISDPKSKLNQMVQTLTDGSEKTYTNYADAIARQIDIERVAARCPQFKDFLKSIDDCMRPRLTL
jgi:hypothetical protein